MNNVWNKGIKAAAEPERVRHFLDALTGSAAASKLDNCSTEQARVLSSLFSGSLFLGNLIVTHPDWVELLEIERLQFPRRGQGLRKEVQAWMDPLLEAKDYPAALRRLREFKQREMLRIGARDLARLGTAPELTQELSDVADVCLSHLWEICMRQATERFGQPWHQDADGRWQRTGCCVLGMGKLGGQELNYSSDVDVLFVYTEEGQVFKEAPGAGKSQRPVHASHQFFKRLSEAFIAEVSHLTPDGMLYRIDLRLRPEGDSGPLSRSLASYENYYAQWGQTWERMMLIKARTVAGDDSLGAEFLEMIQPFRYPRSVNSDVLHEIGAMKDRIESEVVRENELDRNVKLGHGGIREIEFLAQSQQVLHAGRLPFLQGPQTLPCLEKLAQYGLLPGADARAMRDAYCFFRDVEHRLQMDENRQTHTIPTESHARERLARLMGFGSADDFESTRKEHSNNVRRVFDRVLRSERSAPAADPFPAEFAGAEGAWKRLLLEHSFRDADKAFRVLREFVEGPGYIHVSPRTIELARKLLPRLFALCPKPGSNFEKEEADAGSRKMPERRLSDPDRVVTRLDSFIAVYGARSVLFELWYSNPGIFELLLLLFDRSEFLAELAIRTPDMVDELVTSGRLRQRKTARETLRDLRHGLHDEDQRLWLRRYHETELMRIGLRDILGLADFEQYLQELSALADACLQYALEVAMRRNRLKSPPFAIIGLGKLGGSEIDYGSDLDIVFVSDSKAKNLRKLQEIALEVVDLISTRTERGLVFHADTRLRPDGEKGLVVNTLAAYEDYYRQRAQLWEIQTITRTRLVAGDSELGREFQELAAALTNFRTENVHAGFVVRGTEPEKKSKRQPSGSGSARRGLSVYSVDWKKKIDQMRMRIQKERTPAGKDALAIKTGKGGLVDAEFVAQALCMENGWQEANTLRALERGREAGVLPDADKLIENYRRLRRVEGILRRWSYEGETVLPEDPAPYYRVSVRCGFETPEAFRDALASWRRAIRSAYERVFGGRS